MLPSRALPLRRLLSAAVGCAILGGAAMADAAGRPEQGLNPDWRFHFGDMPGAAQLAEAPADWSAVSLPHTWNAQDGADGGDNYARGPGWYLRRFKVGAAWAGRRIFLQFDAASRVAEVFVNGQRLGEHVGGFARFRFDVTDALKPAGTNVLAVRVNNADDGTAPMTADFTFFGGLYRGVKLFATDPLHVDVLDYASDGVYVTPRQVSAAHADFSVAVRLKNDSSRAERVTVRTVVRDARGVKVASTDETKEIAAGGEARCAQEFALDRPHLWDGQKDPHQYAATVSVLVGRTVHDEVTQRFGLRSFSVDPDKGFFLNGAHLDLHGVCRHQDRAGKGWAISAEDEREDFALIRELGATAIRVAHYQQSPLWFDLADESGIVLWAEVPVVNEVPPTALYTANAHQQLRELVRQNYNRPAICFWGVGNETREVGETAGKTKVNGPEADRVIADLAKIVHEEDATRLSTYASYHRPEDVKNFHTDVLAYNKYFGWYSGKIEDFAGWADDVHKRYPTLRFGMSEYGAGANPQQHDTSGKKPVPTGAWHPEEYQAATHESQWQAMHARDYLWGKFIWNMFDFAVDNRAEGAAPGMNDKGLVTYDRKLKKDAFYWYQANWSAQPIVHLTGRRFTDRPTGKTEIKAYATAGQAELFLNGTSCGTVSSDNHLFRWNVDLPAGKNRVVVKVKNGFRKLSDECVFSCQPPEKK